MNKKKALIASLVAVGIIGAGLLSRQLLTQDPQPTPRPVVSIATPSPTPQPAINPESSPTPVKAKAVKRKAQVKAPVKAQTVPIITPVAGGPNAFAGDRLRLPDGTTYTVPPSTQIIFQKGVTDDWSSCHMTWQQAVKVTPREIPNQCRIWFGEVQWFFGRCMARRPLNNSPTEIDFARKGYKSASTYDAPDCRAARALAH